MVDHNQESLPVETEPEKLPQGRPPEITDEIIDVYLDAISDGMTVDQAADIAGFHKKSIQRWVREHPGISARVSRATSLCVQKRIKAQASIGDCTDVKGLNAAVKANACLLAAYDSRFRKARDGEGGIGGGVTINMITAIAPQSMAGFFAAGGKAAPEAVKLILKKYGPDMLGDIDEATALTVAAESVSENKNWDPVSKGGGHGPDGRAHTHTIDPDTLSEDTRAAGAENAEVVDVAVDTAVGSVVDVKEGGNGA